MEADYNHKKEIFDQKARVMKRKLKRKVNDFLHKIPTKGKPGIVKEILSKLKDFFR